MDEKKRKEQGKKGEREVERMLREGKEKKMLREGKEKKMLREGKEKKDAVRMIRKSVSRSDVFLSSFYSLFLFFLFLFLVTECSFNESLLTVKAISVP